ncbi:spore germination protein [Rossellomorea vietnamensis]|uniref:Spore germination protein n=2 Tax=Rossellomorea TaxID=2837508 RepID=A0A5D4KH24_9BACI|nr:MULTISPECIES: spore germination protein [Rossellomorea]TYR76179.1 spore germination protein [Rossellomorea vietnamensis]TYS74100.1 spore germination protein [Rossellomorea aquimaris]
MFSLFKRKKGTDQTKKKRTQESFEKLARKSTDYKEIFYYNQHTGLRFGLNFLSTLVDEDILQKDLLPSLLGKNFTTLDDVKKLAPIIDIQLSEDESNIEQKLMNGYVLLKTENEKNRFAFIAAQKEVVRQVSQPEVEFSVVGPKEAFVESIDQNLNMLRKRVPIKELIIEDFNIGRMTHTKTSLLYIDGLADQDNVQTMRQRLKAIDFDQINDSSFIEQMIADNANSPFPQLLDTERPDRAASVLVEGKVVVLSDGSPHALIGPTTLVEFFSAYEDYFLNYIVASFFRLVRVFAVAFSILITPVYVAALTYHYELIPKDLMATLITSRQEIPLPPILEALFLELTIELLREAGARLPTKVGQTIGIVGGIVIGTASVEAGLTSNVLLILVALAALASFTTPVYKMGNTIRILRFPFLLFAQIWGMLGIVFCFCILMTHLIKLTSLGRPFLEPLYPPRLYDLKDAIIRFPFHTQSKRPAFMRTKKPSRFKPEEGRKKLDIDE